MGYVYFISDGHGHMKIGKAEDPSSRLKELQVGNPFELKICELIEVEDFPHIHFDAVKFEGLLHQEFKDFKIRNEWFSEEPVVNWLNEVHTDIDEHPKSRYASTYFHYSLSAERIWGCRIKNRNRKLYKEPHELYVSVEERL